MWGIENDCVGICPTVFSLLCVAVSPFDYDIVFHEGKGALKFTISIGDFIKAIFVTQLFLQVIALIKTQIGFWSTAKVLVKTWLVLLNMIIQVLLNHSYRQLLVLCFYQFGHKLCVDHGFEPVLLLKMFQTHLTLELVIHPQACSDFHLDIFWKWNTTLLNCEAQIRDPVNVIQTSVLVISAIQKLILVGRVNPIQTIVFERKVKMSLSNIAQIVAQNSLFGLESSITVLE